MDHNKKILRRDFIFYFLSAFILAFLIKYKFKEDEINFDYELNKKIKNYNSSRDIKSKKELKKAIEYDLKNNKTIFVGKNLYTFAEIGY